MAAALVRAGCQVDALCPEHHPLVHVAGIGKLYRYRGLSSLESVATAIRSADPDVIVPCDDGVVAQLHRIHERAPKLRNLIAKSLGDPANFPIVRNRFELLDVARQLGLPVPLTQRVTTPEQVQNFWENRSGPKIVIKVDGETGGNGVRICSSLDQSLGAYAELGYRFGLATACKRLLVDRDPLAFWNLRSQRGMEITVQEFICGRPANAMLALNTGRVLSKVSVEVLVSDGPTGAANVIRRVQNTAIGEISAKIADRLKLSGFVGLDFVISAEDGKPYLIEMNPRCTQLGHLEFPDQCSLAAAYSANLSGSALPVSESPITSRNIFLFPQNRATAGAGMRADESAYLDVPVNQPALTSELLLEPWPQRQWLARLYHSLKPIRRPPATIFTQPIA